MSFFVSDAIKNRVDASCLSEFEKTSNSAEEYSFTFSSSTGIDVSHEMKDVLFKKNKIEICCDLNLALIDKLLANCLVHSINFKKVSISIKRSRIIKIIRVGQDSYKVKIDCYPKEGEHND